MFMYHTAFKLTKEGAVKLHKILNLDKLNKMIKCFQQGW